MTFQDIQARLNARYPELLFTKTMDIQVERLDKDKAVLSLACNADTLSPQGSLYGGLVGFAADLAIWNAMLTRDKTLNVVTTDLNVHFLERMTEGRVRFEAVILRYGSRIIMGECEVYNAQGVLAAHVTASFLRQDA